MILESSWTSQADAATRHGELKNKGIQTNLATVDLGAKGVWHRVLIGPFPTIEKAKAERDALAKRLGVKDLIILRKDVRAP